MRRKSFIRLSWVMALILAFTQPAAVFAEENAVSVSEVSEATEETVEKDLPLEPEGSSFEGELTQKEREIKEDVIENDIPGEALKAKEGEDYVSNEVICMADSWERAAYIAAEYGGTLKSYRYGVAVIDLTGSGLSVCDAVEIGASADNGIPAVEPNYLTDIEEPLEEENENDAALNAAVKAEKTDWECIYSPVSEGGLGFDDPALNPENPDYQWMHDMIHTYGAWGISTGSSDVTVAVIDSGVHSTHEELNGRVQEADLRAEVTKKDYVEDAHGTHVAGIIAAAAGNDKGGAGVAPGVNLLSLKVGYENVPTSALIEAFNYAAGRDISQRRADIINISMSGLAYSSMENEAVQYAYGRGLTIVACLGNDFSNSRAYPAAFDHVIGVCAFDESGSKAAYSNFGSWADISAPGSNIYSTSIGSDSAYEKMSGTSMATPLVSGACALYMSALGHHVDPDEMEKALKKNVTKVSGKDTGAGILDVSKLLTSTGKPSAFSKELPQDGSDRQEKGENLTSEKAAKVVIDTDASYESRPEYKVTRAKKTGALTSVQLYTVNVDDEEAIDEKTIVLRPEILSKAGADITGGVRVSWSSSNTKIAELIADESGNSVTVRAVGKGCATITCLALDGSKKKASVKVNVIVPVSDLAIVPAKDPKIYELMACGKSSTFKAVAGDTYGTPTNSRVTWDYDFYTREYDGEGNFVSNSLAADNASLKAKKLVTVSNGKLKLAAESKWSRVAEEYYNIYSVKLTARTTDGTEREAEYWIAPGPATTSVGVYTADAKRYNYWIKQSGATVYSGSGGLSYRVFLTYKGWGSNRLYPAYCDFKVVSSKPEVAHGNVKSTATDNGRETCLIIYPESKGTTTLTLYASDGSGAKGKFKVTVR